VLAINNKICQPILGSIVLIQQ